MEQKHYMEISRFKEKFNGAIKDSDLIHVSEKLDGSNASIGYDATTDEVVCFSRKKQLTPENNLRGFYEFVMSIPKDLIRRQTQDGRLIIFGEWLVPHSVSYPNEAYNHFYIYDIWDTATKSWKSQIEVQIVVHTFKMQHVDVRTPKSFYFGFFKGWEHLYSLVGQTAIGAQPCGEGIVIKNQSRLYNSSDEEPAYIKIVSEKFSEVHEKKPKKLPSLEELEKKKEQEELAKTIITERRIQKFIEKMVDNGILPEDWDERCLGLISKQLPREIYHDCLSEEPEVVAQIDNFGKICGKITMKIVRSLIK